MLWLKAQGQSREGVFQKSWGDTWGIATALIPDGAASKGLRTDECAGFAAGKLFDITHFVVYACVT